MTENGKSWLKDVANGALGTIIGILLTFGFDKMVENHNAQENYTKITAATIINLERYVSEVENFKASIDNIDSVFTRISELDDSLYADSAVVEEFCEMFPELKFIEFDQWIEANFINKGEFIENTDLRLKIGQVYSYKERCRADIEDFSQTRKAEFAKYFTKLVDNEKTAISATMDEKSFQQYVLAYTTLQANLETYLKVMEYELNEIISIAKIDDAELNKLRESAQKLEEIMNAAEEVEEDVAE